MNRPRWPPPAGSRAQISAPHRKLRDFADRRMHYAGVFDRPLLVAPPVQRLMTLSLHHLLLGRISQARYSQAGSPHQCSP